MRLTSTTLKYVLATIAIADAAGAELRNQAVNEFGELRERRVYEEHLPSYGGFEYRTYDGENNNEANPNWGQAHTYYIRKSPHGYTDSDPSGASISGENRPSARHISNTVMNQESSIPNSLTDGVSRASDFLWQWGQFIDHDIDETGAAEPRERIDIEIPSGDRYFDSEKTGNKTMRMSRSDYDVIDGVRQQKNRISAFIDASAVYGCDRARNDFLRAYDGSGKLRTSEDAGKFLPYNMEEQENAGGHGTHLFFAGDVRANEQAGLTALHTLFMREHNYWAAKINSAVQKQAPSLGLKHTLKQRDEFIFQRARMIVAAEMQVITYDEFLPVLLGEGALSDYPGYDDSVNPSIANEFVAASYRVGHTMLSDQLWRLEADGSAINDGHINLKDAFFQPKMIQDYGIEPYLRGLAKQPAQGIDTKVVHAVRNFLFQHEGGFDLAALNIQRGRDHGIPSYNAVRTSSAYELDPVYTFDSIPGIDPADAEALMDAYGEDNINECDLWVCALAEGPYNDGMVGETLHAVLKDQFERLRDGDRFWYENDLTPEMQKHVRSKATLSQIIWRNTDIGDELQDNAFIVPKTVP